MIAGGPEKAAPSERIPLVAAGLVAVLFVMAMRVAQLTVLEHEELALKARRQHRETVRITGMRGAIYDRAGAVLAETTVTSSVYASPRRYPVPPAARPALAEALGASASLLDRRLDSDKGFVWLRRRLTREQARAAERLGLPGVGSIPEGRRIYPQGSVAAHVLGTAGADLRGLEGIELRYDRWMRGAETALEVERDGLGRLLLTDGFEGAAADGRAGVGAGRAGTESLAPGASLTLTIDSGLQELVERQLAKGVETARADAGTAIVLDPRSGAVLALANVPTFDPNRPGETQPGSRRNRAVTDSFEPGSTFKAILAAAALEERAVRPEDSVFCENGSYRIGKWTIHDHHPYGLLSVPEVIQFSSNIGVSKIAERLGRERYGRYLTRFGFGRRTSIDLPGEVSGIVRPAATWAQIDLATGSFGQGLSVTPIQLAAAYAALANGGRLVQPHLLARATDQNGRVLLDRSDTERGAAGREVVSPATARLVTDMLVRVVELDGGTGSRARIAGVRVAGKTGTAQKVDSRTGRYSRERLSSFVGFAPADDPVLLTLVMIDNPRGSTYGGLVAAPIFREIMSSALDRLGIRPGSAAPAGRDLERTRRLGAPAAQPIATDVAAVRSFVGMSLRRALAVAAADGLAVEARGSGYVKEQDPPPGAPRADVTAVVLVLEPWA